MEQPIEPPDFLSPEDMPTHVSYGPQYKQTECINLTPAGAFVDKTIHAVYFGGVEYKREGMQWTRQ